ncbi:MAG: hypothetical protein E7046_09605 [Lentisphaerae bacterium]|nr:hypothetical protein [Lentisphaerota bacterium]
MIQFSAIRVKQSNAENRNNRKPGASTWNWWVESNNSLSTNLTLKLVGFATEMRTVSMLCTDFLPRGRIHALLPADAASSIPSSG